MASFEYKTDTLTSIVGEEKLRIGDLEDSLNDHGKDGWELVSITANDLYLKSNYQNFQRYAEDARKNCIVSRALSVPMTVQATLAGA